MKSMFRLFIVALCATTVLAQTSSTKKKAATISASDVQQLKDAGYSEDAIFEITVTAAVGAGLHRLNTGLALLRGAPHAS